MKLIKKSNPTKHNRNPSCVFCDSHDTGLTIEGLGICNYHLATLKGEQPTGQPALNKMRRRLYLSNLWVVRIDDAGRVLIPEMFCRQLGLQKGSRLTALVHITNKFAELFVKEDGSMCIDDSNRVLLSPNIVRVLGWDNYDKIAVTMDKKHNLLRLTLEDKYVPRCVFCGSNDTAVTVQGSDICKFHLQEIKGADSL